MIVKKIKPKLVDGKVVDGNGNVLARGVSLGVEAPHDVPQATGRRDAMRMIQFIPGGTGKQGVLPVQTLRME